MGMNLDHGGHLTHGSPVNMSGKYFKITPYGVNEEGVIDYDNVLKIAKECRPKLIIAGASAYARTIDFKRFRETADEVGAYLMVDMAHIAGLVAGASKGEGLGNQFLSHIRETDAIAHVVRCFDDENITHVEGGINPVRDMGIINTELCLADLESVDKKRVKTAKLAQAGIKEAKAVLPIYERVFQVLQEGIPARTLDLAEDELVVLKELNLITLKPVLYVLNTAEDDIANPMDNPYVQAAAAQAEKENAKWVPVSAEIEQEVSELEEEEAKAFLSDLGETEPGLNRLIRTAYAMLGLINFFTVGEDECRAWTVHSGTKAPKAAGKIHSDIERGFIRAEIITYDELIKCGSFAAAREKGLLRVEGKEYIIKDGDIAYFRFNV